MALNQQIVPAKSRHDTILSLMEKMKPEFKRALPRSPALNPDRMIRLAATTMRRTPQLQECNPISFVGALLQACQLGLEPDGVLGEFWFTPRKIHGEWEVVSITGYKGLMKLARQSGEIRLLDAHPVYEGDMFDWAYGDAPFVKHKPGTTPRDPKKITHVYAVAVFQNGAVLPRVMTRAEIEEVQRRWVVSGDSGPWVSHWTDMAVKTVVRRLCKFLPQSTALSRAVALDELAEAGISQGLDALVDTATLGIEVKPKNGTLDKIGAAMDQAMASREPVAPESAPAPAAGGAGELKGGSKPENHVPPPVASSMPEPTPPPVVPVPLPMPTPAKVPRQRGTKFPKEVEKPIQRTTTEPPVTRNPEPEPDWATGPEDQEPPTLVTPDQVVAVMDQMDREAEAAEVAAGNQAPVEPPTDVAITAVNVFNLIKATSTEEDLEDFTERLYASAFWAGRADDERRMIKAFAIKQRGGFTA